ncbi:MAG: segregation/condensation protein A [Oligoflexia bacterium]|nr:segregation/condensation protein A [Oligoflexia bacterium]
MNEYLVKLESFEGPLELLLFLIRKNEINIYDIPIAKITEEYLAALETMKEMNLEIAGEFLLMASTLIYIKSRMLLPVYREEDDPAETGISEDPREELVRLLLEYQQYQEAGQKLGERDILGRNIFKHPRRKSDDEERPVANMGLIQLINAYRKVVDKYKDQLSTHQVDLPLKSLQEKMQELSVKYPDGFLNLALDELVSEPVTRGEIVITFLSVLELARLNYIKLIQVSDDGDILLTTIRPLSLLDTSLIRKDELFDEVR